MAPWLLRERGERVGITAGRSGAVVVAQRFGSALNLNLHFHALVLDGVYASTSPFSRPVFQRAEPLTDQDVVEITTRLHRRILRYLTWLAADFLRPSRRKTRSSSTSRSSAITSTTGRAPRRAPASSSSSRSSTTANACTRRSAIARRRSSRLCRSPSDIAIVDGTPGLPRTNMASRGISGSAHAHEMALAMTRSELVAALHKL